MVDDKQGNAENESGLDQLKGELGNFLHARTQHLISSASDRVTSLASKPGNIIGGDTLSIGRRILGGESPVKAFIGQKVKGLKDKAVDSVKNIFGGGGGGGKAGSTKVTNIIESVDIGLPRRLVYDTWTQLEEFSGFTKGVQSVSMSDEVDSDWKMKVAFSNRSWKATVQEQIPDQRIVWTSEGAKGTTHGAVSFHALTPDLTRVVLAVEYYPSGFFEKTGNLWRAQGRRMRLDFKHFQRHVTLTGKDELGEGWRGEIRDGEVVLSHEDAVAQEQQRAGEEEGEGEEARHEEEPRREEEEHARDEEERGEEGEEPEEYPEDEEDYEEEERGAR